MAEFVLDLELKESQTSQWKRFLQEKSFNDDILQSIGSLSNAVIGQGNKIQGTINKASKKQVDAINEGTRAICGTLQAGFSSVNSHLQEVTDHLQGVKKELTSLYNLLDWKFSILIEQQKLTNLLLGNIAVLQKISNEEKQRHYYIENGIKFLKNSFFDNSFYEDALENFLNAEKLEPRDYFVLHNIGLIYLYSPNLLNLNKAESYFTKAAKYAFVETNSGAITTNNHLRADALSQDINEQGNKDSIKYQAAESYILAGRACYIQGKFNEAAEFAEKAFSILPNMIEAGFLQAKSLSANNETNKSINILRRVLERDRYYSLKILSDFDLNHKQEVVNFLKKLNQETILEAEKYYSDCLESAIIGSVATDEILAIRDLIDKGTYLHVKEAIDKMLWIKNHRSFSSFNSKQEGTYNPDITLIEFPALIKQIVNILEHKDYGMNDVYRHVADKLNPLIDLLNIKSQWQIKRKPIHDWKNKTLIREALSGLSYESKIINSTLLDFIKHEKKYADELVQLNIKVVEISHAITAHQEKVNDLRNNNNKEQSQKHTLKIFVYCVIIAIVVFIISMS
jgi:tetratricopeptide (TPR) repeat protein